MPAAHAHLQDLRLDLVDASKRFAGCLDAHADVHRGFQGTWERTADAVYEQVQSLLQNHPDAPILFTGHSLGAAWVCSGRGDAWCISL